MFLSSSAVNSESKSWNPPAPLDRFVCPHLDSFFPRSDFCDLPWSCLRFFVESAIPSTRFFGFILHMARVVVFLQTSQLGSFGHWVNTMWFPLGWEPMIPLLLLVSFASVYSPMSVATEGSFSSRDYSSTTSCVESPPEMHLGSNSVKSGRMLQRNYPGSRIGPLEEINMFQKRRKRGHWCESVKHKQPRFIYIYIYIYICPQIAATSTVIQTENKATRRPKAQGNLQHRMSHWWPRRTYKRRSQGYPKREPAWRGTLENVTVHIGSTQIKQAKHDLTSELHKVTLSQKNWEMIRIIAVSCCIIKTFFLKKWRLLRGGFGISKGRKAMYFSLVSPLDPNPDPKYTLPPQ